MESEFIAQTALDQMVGTDQGQLLKALIPYLPLREQQLFSLYAKAKEFSNTVNLFGSQAQPMRMQAVSASQPVDILNDLRRYCFGNTRRTLDQITNMMAMVEMIKVMNSTVPEDSCEEERQ